MSDRLEVILRPNTFFDTSTNNLYQNQNLKNIIQKFAEQIPSEIKRKNDLTPTQRASQLQFALELANRLEVESTNGIIPQTKIRILLNPCDYDFSAIRHTTDVGVDVKLTALRPKLVIKRSNLIIEGRKDQTKLFYSGPSVQSDVTCGSNLGACHARVMLVTYSNKSKIELRGITIQGDMTSDKFFEPQMHLHENFAALTNTKARYGMVMVGYPVTDVATTNEVLISDCVFSNINMRAIQVHGNVQIENSQFRGSLPVPVGPPSGEFQNRLSCHTNPNQTFCVPNKPALPVIDFGMNWHSGVSLHGASQQPTIIRGNNFSSFIEGIVGKNLSENSFISDNGFDFMGDHAVYMLGRVYKSDISRNNFSRVLSHVIKMGAHSTRSTPEEVDLNTGPYESTFDQNTFSMIRGSAYFLSGSFNRITNNLVTDEVDSTGWFNREWIVGDLVSRNPVIWISTYGGNKNASVCGYFNHAAGNLISDLTAKIPDIFIQQMDDSTWSSCANFSLKSDRSIQGTQIKGNALVYHRARQNSLFGKQLYLTGGASLQPQSYPPRCGGCARTVIQ